MNTVRVRYVLAIGWALFILFATIASTSTLQNLSLGDLFQYDKLIHATLFGVQTWLLVNARIATIFQSYKRVVVVSALTSAVYGIATEMMQGMLTTTRTFDYYDAVADGVGCLVVVIVLLLHNRKVVAQ